MFERTMTSTNDGARIYYKLTYELSAIIITIHILQIREDNENFILIKTSFASVMDICVFRYWWKEIESIIHLEQAFHSLTPRLHYVPGGHGGHVSGHRGRNGVTVRQRRGTVSTNVSRRDCRGRRGKFFNSQKICHGNHGADDLLFRM